MSEKPTEESWRRAENVVVDAINACVFDGMRRVIALALDEAEKRGAVAAREKVAQWMIVNSIATGHGDTIEDLLREIPTYSTRNAANG